MTKIRMTVFALVLALLPLASMPIEVLNWRYHLLDEIFKENSAAASILAGSFVLGIFYTVVQIVIH